MRVSLWSCGLIAFLCPVVAAVVGLAQAEKPEADKSQAEDAQQVMVRAHEARAQWKDFPGFEAELWLQSNGKHLVRDVVVTPELKVKWNEPIPVEFVPLKRRFESVVQHRAATDEYRFDVEFVAEQASHPLGRLIRFRNDPMHSQYRIRGDLIAQVSRDMGPLHFTISVLDAVRNAQGKYLPRVYTVSFWNRKSGLLVRSTTVMLEWKRQGRWDLPLTIRSITTQGNRSHLAEVIQVRNCRLRNGAVPEDAGNR